MNSSKGPMGLDMNDPSNLALYSQLIVFKIDLSREQVVFNDPENAQQRTLQSFAHMLELAYEYSLATRNVRITRVTNPMTETCTGTSSDPPGEDPPEGIVSHSTQHASASPTLLSFPDFDLGSGDYDTWADLEALELDTLQEQSKPVTGTTHFSNSTFLTPRVNGLFAKPADDDFASKSSPPTTYLSHAGETTSFSIPQDFSFDGDWPFTDLGYGEPTAGECPDRPRSAMSNSSELSKFSSPTIFSENVDEDNSSIPTESTSFSSYTSTITSRPSSINSIKIRGRHPKQNLFSRRSNTIQRSTGFDEVVFDSNQNRVASQASSGRRGPLDTATRATMNAVKAVGACWRCKFLRKPCSAETPCLACPKGSFTSNWGAVGCKRGELKDEMPPTSLCPRFDDEKTDQATVPPNSHQNMGSWEIANFCLRKSIERRDGDIAYLKAWASGVSSKDTDFALLVRGLESDWPITAGTPLGCPTSPALRPLDECILAIIWEALACPWSPVIPGECSLGSLQLLLRAAAVYQTKVGSTYLIAQSLHCLRLCLEAMHGTTFGSMDPISHTSCRAALCNVDGIHILEVSCQSYLEELSSVFFKKENLRDKAWWLSAFYSFCIQAHVRKALMLLEDDLGLEPRQKGRYLHIAIRLFIASSGKHDPLIQDWSSALPETQSSIEERAYAADYRLAQCSVQQVDWASNGIAGSGDYLKQLFEDDGEALGARAPESDMAAL